MGEDYLRDTAAASLAFAAVVERWEDGYVAYLEDAGGVLGQGDSREEALGNLRQAVLFTLGAPGPPRRRGIDSSRPSSGLLGTLPF